MASITISKRLVVINSASSLVAKLVNMTVLLWMYQYLLKHISADEFAVLPVVMSLMVFAPLFFSFFTGGIARYLVDAYAKGDTTRVTGIVSSIFPLLAVMAVVFLTLGILLAINIAHVLNIAPGMENSAGWMMGMLFGSFALQMLGLPFAAGFYIRQSFVELNLWGLARDLLRITLLLIFLLGIGPHVIWVSTATAISEISYTLATVWRSRRMVPELRLRRALFDFSLARQLMSFGLWTTLGRLGWVMYTNAATILLNLYGTAVDVTSYHIGSTFYRQIESTLGLAAQPLQPVMTAMNALEDRERLARTVFRGGRYALWVGMAVAVPLTIYSSAFITLYMGPDYTQTAMVIVMFMVIFPFTNPTFLLPMTAMSTGRVKEFFLPAFLSQFTGLILMGMMLHFTDLGAIGVTLALSVITIGGQLLYFWPLVLKLTGQSFGSFTQQVLKPGFIPAAAGGLVWAMIRLTTDVSSWSELIVSIATGGIAYLAALLVFGLRASERSELRRVLTSLRTARGQLPP
ncbi:lipopolysaccharide biosynthesis protein [Frigidibacter sp. ROC022]|uniref:lipopolysaccharide biosynthesis protein n=1 Tax=Frigidibacter sp. ROC022 TaxID=2971796 RepID=UPI00215B1E11|nr:oligosaccharide flippase family protein [Frigidibacter sp. ROC022]